MYFIIELNFSEELGWYVDNKTRTYLVGTPEVLYGILFFTIWTLSVMAISYTFAPSLFLFPSSLI